MSEFELQQGNVVFVPVMHGKMPFALEVRRAILRERPSVVAVEFPETLQAALDRTVKRLPLLSLIRYKESDGADSFVLIEPCDGLIEAVRTARDESIPWFAVDRDTEAYQGAFERLPDPAAMEGLGYEVYVKLVCEALGKEEPNQQDAMREANMAYHLNRLSQKYEKVLFVCGMAHAKRVQERLGAAVARPISRVKREKIETFHLHRDSSREVLSEPGYICSKYEKWRRDSFEAPTTLLEAGRYALVRELLFRARDRMASEDGEKVDAHALRAALQFARNQALIRGGLAPDMLEMIASARGVHSDDFAWHVWDIATDYEYQADPADLASYRVTLEELARRTHQLHFHRRVKTRRHVLRLVRMRKQEEHPGDWKREPGTYTCSHQPEDIKIEAFGSFLRKRAKGIVASNRSRVVPFSSSICDGIDVRETIRNITRDGRLYVREEMPIHGEISALLIIFDEKDAKNKYPFKMTWQGEHNQESDMALYATSPDAHFVGPGICRCEYGGFLMTYPPGRLFHVFEDPFFDEAETPAERLLLAAIDYAESKWILYVAARPPRSRLVSKARRSGKQVLYIPIGQLSPQTLRNLRIFHVLEGKEVRSYAKDYI